MTFEEFYNIFEKYGFYECNFNILENEKFQDISCGVSLDNNHLTYSFSIYNREDFSYNFDSLDELVNAKVFDGKSLKELWYKIEIESLDYSYTTEDYEKPKIQESIIFNYKHKDLVLFERLKDDRKNDLKISRIPIISMLLSLIYFVCALTVITYDQPNNTILSLIFLGLSIITIITIFAISDIKRAKKIKYIYKFSDKEEKSSFYKQFENYWKYNVKKQLGNEKLDNIKFGPMKITNFVKIKDAYILFKDTDKENIEIIFLNDYAKLWDKKTDDVYIFEYKNYKDIEDIIKDIKKQIMD